MLTRDDKPRTIKDINKFIYTEISNPKEDLLLYSVVVNSMIYRKCSVLGPNVVYI